MCTKIYTRENCQTLYLEKKTVQKSCFSQRFAWNCAKINTEFWSLVEGARKFVRAKISTNKVFPRIQISNNNKKTSLLHPRYRKLSEMVNQMFPPTTTTTVYTSTDAVDKSETDEVTSF